MHALTALVVWAAVAGAPAPPGTICELELKEVSGVARRAWPVTTGVPLPVGLVNEPSDVILLDAGGKPVPAQFEVQSRWLPRDRSIRWLLIDTQADLKPGELRVLVLARKASTRGASLPAEAKGKKAIPPTLTLPRKGGGEKMRDAPRVGEGEARWFFPLAGAGKSPSPFPLAGAGRSPSPFPLAGAGGSPSPSPLAGEGRGEGETSRLRVTDGDHVVTAITGPLKLAVSKREGFQLFSAVWLDLDGDGKFTVREQIVKPSAEDGAALHEMSTGKWHRSAGAAPRAVTVETAGPLRVVIRIDGTHVAPGGIEGGCYDYTTRIHAYADKPFVKVQYTLKNLRWQRPFRSYQFKDGLLATSLNLADRATYTFGHEKQPISGKLTAGRMVSLYQDSSGGPRWQQDRPNQYATWPDGKIPGVTFRGYKIRRGEPGTLKEIAAGNYAPGWADLSDDRWGLTVFVPDFAPQYPKALDVVGNRIIARLFAPYGKRTHWLEYNTAKTHDLFYWFHQGPVAAARTAEMVKALEEPVFLLPSTKWVSDSRAWDMDLAVPPAPRSYQRGRYWRADGRSAGWSRFASFWYKGGINAGGYHTNMDTVLGRFIQTGDYEIFRHWSRAGRMMVELVPWSPEGFRFAPGKTRHTRRAYNRHPLIPDHVDPRTGRHKPAFAPDEYEFYRYWVARLTHSPHYKAKDAFVAFEGYRSNEFGRPDSGHFGVYPATETYHLTGDPVLREGLQRVAEVMKFQIGHGDGACPAAGYGARYQGWYQTGLAQIYNCTGDGEILPYLDMTARWALDHLRKNPRGFYGHRPPQGYGDKLFFVSGLIGGLYQNYRLTRCEDARDAIVALNDWVVHFVGYTPRAKGGAGLPYMWVAKDPRNWKGQWHPRRCIPFAYGYLLTGRQDIYEIGADLYAGKPDPYFGAHQSWRYVAQHPRQDTVSPAAVTDLAVEALGGGRVRVGFTAPGDDGSAGAAAEYQVKWSSMPIVEAIKWPDQKDTHRAFWWAQNISDEPGPSPAGTKVAFEIAGLKPGTLWCAMKSFDEAGNISALSNVAQIEVR